MTTTDSVLPNEVVLKRFYAPKNLIRRFVAKRASKSSIIIGVIFGLYMITKADGYVKLYPTEAARQKVAETLGSNIGIEALLGVAHRLETVGGYAVWNFLCLLAAAGAIWGLLLATKTLRGEEDNGRWEILLAGQTSARRAAANALIGLGSGLAIVYLLVAISVLSIGHLQGANFTTSGSLFFGLALVSGAVEFMTVGALASQLMAVRSRAVGLSVIVFGIFYLMRLTADTTNAHWLLNVSPLGWIEKLQPLYNSQPIWLLPIAVFSLLLCLLTVYLAGQRDLGDAIFADKDSAKPHTKLLGSPLLATVRLNRSTIIGWLSATALLGLFYGLLTKGATKAFSQSSHIEKALNKLDHISNGSATIAFMGIIFFLIMIMVMFYAASSANRIREDEAQGYLENFLVRPVSRWRYLAGRILLTLAVIAAAGLLSGLAVWVGQASQHAGVAFNSLILAGFNAMTPVVFIFAVGIFAFGIKPRLTSVVSYGVTAWTLLVYMLSSGLNLNHWLLDASVLHQVAFAPAVSPNWSIDLVIILISLALGLIGVLVFNRRDLQNE